MVTVHYDPIIRQLSLQGNDAKLLLHWICITEQIAFRREQLYISVPDRFWILVESWGNLFGPALVLGALVRPGSCPWGTCQVGTCLLTKLFLDFVFWILPLDNWTRLHPWHKPDIANWPPHSIKRGVILTFYTFCSNKKPEAKPRAFYSQNV